MLQHCGLPGGFGSNIRNPARAGQRALSLAYYCSELCRKAGGLWDCMQSKTRTLPAAVIFSVTRGLVPLSAVFERCREARGFPLLR